MFFKASLRLNVLLEARRLVGAVMEKPWMGYPVRSANASLRCSLCSVERGGELWLQFDPQGSQTGVNHCKPMRSASCYCCSRSSFGSITAFNWHLLLFLVMACLVPGA